MHSEIGRINNQIAFGLRYNFNFFLKRGVGACITHKNMSSIWLDTCNLYIKYMQYIIIII